MSIENSGVNQEYGADQIQILEGLEAVRKRPGMYIGSTSSRGLHHLYMKLWITLSMKRWPGIVKILT